MSVNNGQPADENTFNNAYVSRLSDSDTIGKLDLNEASSAAVTDVQLTINNQRTDIDQNRTDIDTNDTELADHESRISTNETDIAAIQGDYVDLDTNQTIAGEKTFSNNVTINADLDVNGTIASVNDLEVNDNVITVNKNGSDATSEGAGVEVERVGTNGSITYENALDNRFKVGDLASEVEISGIVKDTLVNLQAIVSPSTSNLYFATDTLETFRSDGTSLQPLGSGGGGGGLDNWLAEDFETTEAADFSSGNNATFEGVGTLDGVLSDETISPISGDSSIKYVAGSTSLNDYFASPAISLDDKQKENDSVITFYFTWDGTTEIEAVVWDVTNSSKLNSVLDVVSTADNPTRYSATFYPPSTCTQVKYGFHILEAPSNGDTLIFDDVEFSTNPFVYKNLLEVTDWTAYTPTYTGFGTVSNNSSYYRRVGDTLEIKGSFTVGTTTAVIPKLTLPTGLVIDTTKLSLNNSETASGNVVGSWGNDFLSVNQFGLMITAPSSDSGAVYFGPSGAAQGGHEPNHPGGTTGAVAAAGDIVSYEVTSIPIEGWSSSSEHVVTPASSSETVTNLLTADVTATGVISDLTFSDLIVGNWYAVTYQFVAESNDVTNNTKQIKVNILNGATQIGVVNDRNADSIIRTVSLSSTVFFQATDTTVTFDYVVDTRMDIFGNSTKDETFAQLTNVSRQFLAAIPTQKVAYIKDIKSSGTAGGTFTSGAYRTRDLNTIEGDSEIVSLSSNQFTLQAGKYTISGSVPAYFSNAHQSRVYNITDSTVAIEGSTDYSAVGQSSRSHILGEIEITSAKVFEIRHIGNNTQSTTGFGLPGSFGVNEVYTQVKITKLR